jgi:hypothetical protein
MYFVLVVCFSHHPCGSWFTRILCVDTEDSICVRTLDDLGFYYDGHSMCRY